MAGWGRWITGAAVCLLLGSCGYATPAAPTPTPALSPTAPVQSAPTRAVTATLAATPTLPLPSLTPTTAFNICSPLEAITIPELGQPDLLKNPFQAPRPGMDDGHHGADFAYWSRGEHTAMLGLPVHSVLAGQVAGIILNRPPYGNAIIIETPLESLPAGWLNLVQPPTPAPTISPAPNLRCPADPTDYAAHPGRSLYLLYAHLNEAPTLKTGDTAACGQTIGAVGTTGSSVNPHLHLESRVGPAGAVIPSMSHYSTTATDSEMSTYCTWRVSGLFQMFDPMQLFR